MHLWNPFFTASFTRSHLRPCILSCQHAFMQHMSASRVICTQLCMGALMRSCRRAGCAGCAVFKITPWSGICQQQATVTLCVLSSSRAARIFCVVVAGHAHLSVSDADVARLTLVCLVQAEQQRAKDAGDSSEAEVWRHKLHHYLDQLFQTDQTSGADYHVLQVCPYFGQRMHR